MALARALINRPPLLLADEPTGQLDQNTGQTVLSAILDHADRHGTTVVIATHDPAIAARMEHIWQMTHGHLIAHDTPVPA